MELLPSSEAISSREEVENKLESASQPDYSTVVPPSSRDVPLPPCLKSPIDPVLAYQESTDPDSSAIPKPLLVKRGYRDMTSRLTCGVIFESDPLWLWSLRPNSWASIYLTVSDEARLRQGHPELYSQFEHKFRTIPSTFSADFPLIDPDFMWVCGPSHFVELVVLPPNGNHVFCISNAGRRPPSIQNVKWVTICHRNVGDVTNARGLFGMISPTMEIRIPRDLSRSIGHVIKYSIRPQVCDPKPVEEHYLVSDRLSVSFPRKPVLYATHMSRTGWGIRSLSDGELSACFELPGYVVWNDRYLKDIIPLQLFRSVVDCLTASSNSDPPRVKLRNDHFTTTGSNSSLDAVWLPAVKRWLPGSWADATISDKAVKSDDCPVDFRPWQRRIQLIFPCHTDTLGVLERWSMRAWRRNVCRSLFAYLASTYGPRWRTSFFRFGRKRPVHGATDASSGKRCRLETKSDGGGGQLQQQHQPFLTSTL